VNGLVAPRSNADREGRAVGAIAVTPVLLGVRHLGRRVPAVAGLDPSTRFLLDDVSR